MASAESVTKFDAVIVGAGFAGIYMLHRLRGMGFSARVIEKGTDVGGTWYWNRYPGARCDVESLDYQYSFSEDLQQEWDWTERYATQPEILKYASHVTEKFDLRRDMQFETSVTSATFDESDSHWDVRTDRGDQYSAKHFILATGCLSAGRIPDFKGRDSFEGDSYHTGSWPKEGVDFTGKRVAIIGTGSSGIQSIPHLAAQADHLTVFQRTPNFSLPAYNEGLTAERVRDHKDNFAEIKQMARASLGGRQRQSERGIRFRCWARRSGGRIRSSLEAGRIPSPPGVHGYPRDYGGERARSRVRQAKDSGDCSRPRGC